MDQAREKRDRLHFWREEHPATSKGFAFASLLAQASIASRCQFRFAAEERLEERQEPSIVVENLRSEVRGESVPRRRGRRLSSHA